MRAAKDPLDTVNSVESLRDDTIGHNSGNLLFAAATHALISTAGTKIDTRASFKGRNLAERINEEYDAVVIPLANCFRPAFESELNSISSVIEKLSIPFVMLSGGAQIEYGDNDYSSLKRIEGSVRRFCRAVLSKSSAITVRGEFTADYLRHLGFSEVEVVGCPSLTRMGPDFALQTRPDSFGTKVAYNVETSKDLMGPTVRRLEQSGADLTYVAQDIKTLEALIWGREVYPRSRDSAQPLHLDHPHVSSGRTKFFLDAHTWISAMQAYNAAIGPRIHGAVSAISAGTPALLVAHDTRTKELADYHHIPQISPAGLDDIRSLDDLWPRLDYADFNKVRGAQVQRVVSHLENNGVETTLSRGREADRSAYFRRISAIDYPPAVEPRNRQSLDPRMPEIRRKLVSQTGQIRALERQIASIEGRLSAISSPARSTVGN